MAKHVLLLTIERFPGNKAIWGTVRFEDNLIVDSARSVEGLENKMKKLLHDFHDVNPKNVTFERAYDLTSLFDQFYYLNISAVAEKAGINASLMRQYASGVKKTSTDTAVKVERTIHDIAKVLLTVRIGSSQRQLDTTMRKVRRKKHHA